MSTPFPLPAPVARLVEASMRSGGETSPSLRRAVADRAAARAAATSPSDAVPEALHRLVDKVSCHAYKVTDDDFIALREAGYSENELFELTVCVALSASLARFEGGLEALGKAGQPCD